MLEDTGKCIDKWINDIRDLLISIDEIHDSIAEELEFSELYELGEFLPKRSKSLRSSAIQYFNR